MNMIPRMPWYRLESLPRWPVPKYYNVYDESCGRHPGDKLAMVWEDNDGAVHNIRWQAFHDLSAQYANALVAKGLKPGDRVVVVLRQSPETAAMIIAVLRAGGVLVTFSSLLSDKLVYERWEELEGKIFVTSTEFADRFADMGAQSLLLMEHVDASRYRTEFPTVMTLADAPAFIAYTSGTTGRAKGVVVPNRVMLAGDELSFSQDLRDGELFYGIGDWSWWVRKILGPWRLGAVNLVFRHERYDPERLLQTLARHEVTNAFINATAIRMMMRDPNIGRKYPQKFRVVTSSNEPLGAAAFNWFQEQFHTPPLEFYGCTEVGAMAGGSPYLPAKAGAIGVAVPGVHVRLLDDEGREVPPGAEGEFCILARSNPHYPLGYWKRPEDSGRDFGGMWFRSKDIALMDEDGYFWYVGRKDDVIKAAGYRVGPHEVEAVLRRHPLVGEAAIIGVPDAERGTRIVAYVELKAGANAGETTVAELQNLVRTEHSAFAYPREVFFVDDLPRSASGKTDRTTLRKRYAEQRRQP